MFIYKVDFADLRKLRGQNYIKHEKDMEFEVYEYELELVIEFCERSGSKESENKF